MDALVTIAEFEFPSDLLVARGRLESEGIECYLKDELTVQVYNLLSQAVGGVKLQVAAHDAERATTLLREWDFLPPIEPVDIRWWLELDDRTRKIPIVGRIDLLVARLTVIGALALAAVVTPLVIAMQPSLEDLLVENSWCVHHVLHDGAEVRPNSTGLSLLWSGCAERLSFRREGTIFLPGFDTPKFEAQWMLDKDLLWFQVAEKCAYAIYQGPFSVAVDHQGLVLRSQRTTIHCNKLYSTW